MNKLKFIDYRLDDFQHLIYEVAKECVDILNEIFPNGYENISVLDRLNGLQRYFKIEIKTDNLNFANPSKTNQVIAQISKDGSLYIDEKVEFQLGYFASVQGFVTILLGYKDEEIYKLEKIYSKSPMNMRDVYALFLCVPYDLLLKYINDYYANRNCSLSNIGLVSSIADEFLIPKDKATQLLFLLNMIGPLWYEENIKGKTLKKQIENYGEIFQH